MRLLCEDGNTLLLSGMNVFLYLSGKQKRRNIGSIIDGTFQTDRNKAVHYHRKSSSYGFNYELLRDAHKFGFDKVIVHESNGSEYTRLGPIDVSFILEQGFFLHFKSKQFEKQIFLTRALCQKPIKKPKKEATKDERPQSSQLGLFN